MALAPLPPLPGVDPALAPEPDDPGFEDWLVETVVSPQGVDRMEIWENLHRTPTERLDALQALAEEVEVLRRAYATAPRD
jgi:hypothetical protein